MPRNGSGEYSLPDGYFAVNGTVIRPPQHNEPLEDIQETLNDTYPLAKGGTGGATAAAARTNLGVGNAVTEISDINSTTVDAGWYSYTSSTTNYSALPSAMQAAGVIRVEKRTDVTPRQTVWRTDGTRGTWWRKYTGSAWTPWQPMPGSMGTVVTVEDFGAVGNGTTNDATAIQAAIDYVAGAGGGKVVFADKTYLTRSTITVDGQDVLLEGQSGPITNTSVSAIRNEKSTRILADNANGMDTSEVVVFTTASGERNNGGGIRNIVIDGGGYGLVVRTWSFGTFENVTIITSKIAGILLDVLRTEVLDRVLYDTQHNVFRNIKVALANPSRSATAYGMLCKSFESITGDDETSVAMRNPNNSFNEFFNCYFVTQNQYTIRLEGTTDCSFYDCRTNSSDEMVYYGWMLCSSDQDSVLGETVTKRNRWFGCKGTIWARASQLSGGRPSEGNIFYGHQSSTNLNSQSPIIRETPSSGNREAMVWVHNEYGWLDDELPLLGSFSELTTRNSGWHAYRRKSLSQIVGMFGATKDATETIPAGAKITGTIVEVETAITGATSFDYGVSGGDTDKYGAGIGVTEGTAADNSSWTNGDTPVLTGAQTIRFTANGANFTGGSVRLTVFYETTEVYVPT